jgi:hypothetical protein
MAARGIKTHDSERELSIPDMVYRANMFIMENMSIGNYPAAYTQIEFLENAIDPFKDKKYYIDYENILKIKMPRGNTPMERKRIYDEYQRVTMGARHRALMNLAFRQGWLGATRHGTEHKTDVME